MTGENRQYTSSKVKFRSSIVVGILAAIVCGVVCILTNDLYLTALVLIAGIAATAGLLSAEWALIIAVGSTPFEDFLGLQFRTVKIVKLLIYAVIAATLWVRYSRRSRPNAGDPYVALLVLFLVSAGISTLLSGSLFKSLQGLLSLALFCLFYEGVSRSSMNPRSVKHIFSVITWTGVIACIWAILQSLWGYGHAWGSPEQRLLESAGNFELTGSSLERASSSFGSSNAAGAFFGAMFLIAFLRVVFIRAGRGRYLAISGLALAAILATNSRGAIFGAMGGGAFVAWAYGTPRERIRWFAIAVSCLLLLVFAMPRQRLTDYFRVGDSIETTSLTRFQAWVGSIDLIRSRPIQGIGFYAFADQVDLPDASEDAPVHPHNGLLKCLVEQGIPGGIIYVLFLIQVLRTGARSIREARSNADFRWAYSAITAVAAAFFAQELFDAGLTLGASSLSILFATLLGMQVSLMSQGGAIQATPPTGAHFAG